MSVPFIPANYTVGLCTYSEGALDALNVATPAWSDPVTYPVCAVYPASTGQTDSMVEPFQSGHDRVITELCLITPTDFPANPLDRVTGGVLGDHTFEIVGYAQDHTHGPWWNPGVVVWSLRRIDGG